MFPTPVLRQMGKKSAKKAAHDSPPVRQHRKKQAGQLQSRGPRPRLTDDQRKANRREAQRKYATKAATVRLCKQDVSKLKAFQKQHECGTMAAALTESLRYHTDSRGSQSDRKKLTPVLSPGKPSRAGAGEPALVPSQAVKDWDMEAKLLVRRLQSEGRIPAARMPVVLAISQKLWTGNTEAACIPTPHDLKRWETEFDLADRVLLERKLEHIASVHLSLDGSSKRYVLKCSYWDGEQGKPVRVLMSAFLLPRETAEAFVEEIHVVIRSVGMDADKVKTLMLDLSSTNLGHVGGIVTLLLGTTAAPCDLHVLNRALQVAFEEAFGHSDPGDVHVLQLGYQVAQLLASNWHTYQPLMQRELDKHCASANIPSFDVHQVQFPVLTRWWTVLLNFMWVLNMRKPLMQLAQYVYDYFPSAQSSLREKWRRLHVLLKVRVLRAQMGMVAQFGQLHHMSEMKWSQTGDPDICLPGFKAHLIASRLVQRKMQLGQLLADYKRYFGDVFDVAGAERPRLELECQQFLKEYVRILEKHGDRWLSPPLIFCALGDPSNGRQIAIAILDAGNARSLSAPSDLNRRISTPAVRHHVLWTNPQLHADVTSFALGNHFRDCQFLLRWVQENSFALQHHNQDVEATFNLMDDLASVGGPVMAKTTLDTRMKTYCNEVLAERPHHVSDATGRRKQYHWTKEQCSVIVSATTAKAAKYSADVMQHAASLSIRDPPDYMGAVDAAAAHAAPSRRVHYDAKSEAKAVVVPKAGKCHK